jgi:hypothetical protein
VERIDCVGVLAINGPKTEPAIAIAIMKPNDVSFLHRQAELCTALSRATFDLTIAGRLRTMAEEFRAKAADWEDQLDAMPTPMVSHNGSSNGRHDRD